jgi:hypothetical protein
MRMKTKVLILSVFFVAAGIFLAHRAFSKQTESLQPSDTARLIGTWHATVLSDGSAPVYLTWINRDAGYITQSSSESGISGSIVGSGEFQAEDGQWKTSNPYGPADEGSYHFMDENHVVMEGEAGAIIVWTREAPKNETPKASQDQAPITGLIDDLKITQS